uniref:Uncharacterized protein n=1 Tax=Tanacetum cinerariifolium TaxID=118510 RepID=A0A699H0C3_TANCI|nr:hypothetical protein [Tanacetum cinerariifolium]
MTIRSILLAKKLTGSNFINWYRNLRIVLRYEKKIKFVEQPTVPAPGLETTDPDTIDKDYETVNLEQNVACLMLSSMSPDLQRTLEKYNAYDMLNELKLCSKSRVNKNCLKQSKHFTLVNRRNVSHMGKTIAEFHAMLKLHEKGIPKKAETPAVLAIREGKIQKDKKRPRGAKVRTTERISLLMIPSLRSYRRLREIIQQRTLSATTERRKAPNLSYLRVWGCEALVKGDKPEKLDPRSIKCIFVGYPKEIMGYYFYYPLKNKIYVAQNAKFFENNLMVQEASKSHGLLELSESDEGLKLIQEEDIQPSQNTSEEYELGDLSEPPNYKAALLDPEFDKWLEAMNTELQSMKDNQVWVLVDLLPNGRTIRSKWLFKKKTGMDGNNKRFDVEIKKIGFTQNPDDASVYLKASGSNVVFLILYVDDILLMENNVTMMQEVKSWLCKCFFMKDLRETSYNLGIKIICDRSKWLISLSQSAYLEKILKKFCMENSKKGYTPMIEKPDYRMSQGAKTPSEQNLGKIHWTAVKAILKYLRNTKDMVLVYGAKPEAELKVSCYADASLITSINIYFIASFIPLIMEYLVKISKKARILELKQRNMKNTDSDIQYAVSNKEDTAYLCLHFTKDHEGNTINTPYPSPDFDLFSDQEDYSEEEVTETMAETMEQYMSKTRANYGSGVPSKKWLNTLKKWHNGTSRTRSTETSDGLTAIQAQLNNLRREIKKDTAIRNQGALIKTLEIQIRKISKVLQERGFISLPISIEANPRDHVKSISTTIEADTNPIHRIGSPQAVSTSQNKNPIVSSIVLVNPRSSQELKGGYKSELKVEILNVISLDELIGNLKVHEMIIKKDYKIVKAKVKRKSLALKAKKESSNEECSTSESKDKEYAMAVRDFKKFFKRRDKNQRAFVGVSWSDSSEEDDEKVKNETCLIAQASSEILKLLHMDLFGPSAIRSYEGNRYTLVIVDDYSRKVEESLNVTFNETPPPSKTSPLVDDDLDEEEAIKVTEKNLENDIEDETLEIDEIVNIKESRNHPLENVVGNLNQRTLRSQAQI